MAMRRRLLREFGARIALAVPTLIGVAIVIFLLVRVVPGDVVEIKLRGDGAAVSEATITAERARLGLDESLMVQFGQWMTGLARLDLGRSMWTDTPVSTEIADRLGLTLEVAVLATLISVVIAVPLGAVAAIRRGTWIDQTIRAVTVGGLAMPSFWVAMLILLGLLNLFDWLPPVTYVPFHRDPVANLAQLAWPALAIGFRFSAMLTRVVRSSLIDIFGEDFVRTARAKGVRERGVIVRHALRNALPPTITIIGLEFAFLIGGLVVTEQVFNLNGIGRLFVQSVTRHDFTMVQGITMLIAFVYIAVNLLTDLLNMLVDPRQGARA